MNVVDSSAWLSYFAGDRNSSKFTKGIEDIDKLLVPSVTLTEVFKHILRQRGEEAALIAITHMKQGQVVPLDSELVVNAASVGMEYGFPLADSIIFASAQKFDATIWTQDNDIKDLPKVKYYAKTSSN